MQHKPKILIACIGNIFLGDDAFGCEVARRLLLRPQNDDVRVVDFGIRGLDLVYGLLEEYEAVVLVDAAPRGEAPGSVYLIEPELSLLREPGAQEMLDAHSMQPQKVLRAAMAMGARLDRVLLVGCEPTPFDPEVDMQMELSPAVAAAIDPAVDLIDSLVRDILCGTVDCVSTSAKTKELNYEART